VPQRKGVGSRDRKDPLTKKSSVRSGTDAAPAEVVGSANSESRQENTIATVGRQGREAYARLLTIKRKGEGSKKKKKDISPFKKRRLLRPWRDGGCAQPRLRKNRLWENRPERRESCSKEKKCEKKSLRGGKVERIKSRRGARASAEQIAAVTREQSSPRGPRPVARKRGNRGKSTGEGGRRKKRIRIKKRPSSSERDQIALGGAGLGQENRDM